MKAAFLPGKPNKAPGALRGQWIEDKAHGTGRLEHSDGATYDGNWRGSMKHCGRNPEGFAELTLNRVTSTLEGSFLGICEVLMICDTVIIIVMLRSKTSKRNFCRTSGSVDSMFQLTKCLPSKKRAF